MKSEKIKLSIFTPTYNRAHLLPVLYQSLINQTNKNFIWLIVDDGSKDNTEDLINSWIKENKIKIEYYKKENGGKNTAMDFAHEHCKTEYIACVDSDDYLVDAAIETIYKYFPIATNDSVGLVGLHGDINNQNEVKAWPPAKTKVKFCDLTKICGKTPETFLIFKTSIIKNFRFPSISSEKFITESVFYKQFLYDYYLVTIGEIIKFGEYFSDGYTNQGLNLFFKNPKGYLYALKQDLFYAVKYGSSIKTKVGLAASYYAWKRVNHIKDDFKNDYKISPFYKFVGCILSPIIYVRYKNKYKRFNNDTNTKH